MGVQTESTKLFLRPADSISDFFVIRNIRNECRRFMTNDRREISMVQQVRFFINYPYNQDIELYVGVDRLGERVGYGLISWRGFVPWVTGGIKENQRGNGLGFDLFKGLEAYISVRPIKLEVLSDNFIARKLYKKLGYRVCGKRDSSFGSVVLMELK